MERRQFTFIVIAVLLVLFIWNPFSRGKNAQKIPPPRVTREEAEALAEHIRTQGLTPESYVAGMFRSRDVVFIGESAKIKEQVTFIGSVIPHLYEAGIGVLGVEHALHADQPIIDRLLTSTLFDEETARKLLFDRYVMWGFQEYVDIFRAAWELNSRLSPNERPFRIIGLAVQHDWTVLETEKQLEEPEVKRRILASGLPSTYLAETIEREILDKGEKALVFCTIQQSFTRYRSKQYEENAREEGYDEVRSAGNIIYDRIGGRAATAYMHLFWPDTKSQYGVTYAVGGIVDAAVSLLPEEKWRAGFDTRGNPASDRVIENGIYADEYEELTMKDIYDGYLIFGPLFEYEPATAIAGFFSGENIAEALRNFPAPKESLPSPEDPEEAAGTLNGYLAAEVENTAKFLERFEYP